MARNPFSYILSREADKDLEEIFDYTTGQFGMEQAIKYLSGFDDVFPDLSDLVRWDNFADHSV